MTDTYADLHMQIVDLIAKFSPEYTNFEGEYEIEKLVEAIKRFDDENLQAVINDNLNKQQ